MQVSVAVEHDEFDTAMAVYEHMKTRHVIPNGYAYAALLNKCDRPDVRMLLQARCRAVSNRC